MARVLQWIFVGWFLAVIALVPVSQAGRELADGIRPRCLDVFLQAPRQASLRSYEREIEEASVLSQAARPWVQSAWFHLLGYAGEKVIIGREGWLFYRPDVRYLVEPRPAAADDPLVAIRDFQDQLARRGIRLLVLPVPGKPSIYPDHLDTGAKMFRSHTLDLIDRLKRKGVETLDLFAILGGLHAQRGSEPVYLLRDTHWTPAAARAAAEAVAGRVTVLGWVQAGSGPYSTRIVRVKRPSDIARMIRVPGIESAYPPEEVRCEQVEGYRDDPTSPVLVLGDSFLRIYQTDAPRGAGFIAHLARALRRPVASIVNDGGASTLVRQELSRRPELLRGKQVVIWEFVERDIYFGTEGWKRTPLPSAT